MYTSNRVGESAQPCFTPQSNVVGLVRLSSSLTLTGLYISVLCNALMQSSILPLMPFVDNFCHSSSLGMESKAFLKKYIGEMNRTLKIRMAKHKQAVKKER